MHRQPRRGRRAFECFLVAGLAVMLLSAAEARVSSGRHGPTGSMAGTGQVVVLDPASLRLVGDATRPLSPGRTASINLRLMNPQAVAVRIGSLSVAVHTIEAPQDDPAHPCTAGDFTTSPFTPMAITLGAHADTTLRALGVPRRQWPRIRMRDTATNQDGCKSATLSLTYSAGGVIGR
jgi:hypothetical protein